MSMAHALEVRVPLLDHLLVEHLMAMPDDWRHPGKTPKRLLVESLGVQLPQAAVERPKRGFTLPFAVWMRGRLRAFCEERLGPGRLEQRGLFEPAAVRELWAAFLTGRRDVSWSRLWILVALDDWLERTHVNPTA
jgi:asparagine synthase (glutamine-hydrolysing)